MKMNASKLNQYKPYLIIGAILLSAAVIIQSGLLGSQMIISEKNSTFAYSFISPSSIESHNLVFSGDESLQLTLTIPCVLS